MQPSRKVSIGALGGAIAVVIVWLVDDLSGTDIPAEVATAIGVIVTTLVAYIVPEKDQVP